MRKGFCCALLREALEFQPTLLELRKNGTYVIPVHDGEPENGCLGRSGLEISFCPWSGHPLRPVDRSELRASVDAPHACDCLSSVVAEEDLIVVYDPHRLKYLLPIFDGPREQNCLGNFGMDINFCPWCGVALLDDTATEARIAGYKMRLPHGTRSPRR